MAVTEPRSQGAKRKVETESKVVTVQAEPPLHRFHDRLLFGAHSNLKGQRKKSPQMHRFSRNSGGFCFPESSPGPRSRIPGLSKLL